MNKIIIIGMLLFAIIDANTQTLIATTSNPEATANHNQRKIVRDTSGKIYIVFTDSLNQECVIKGIKYDSLTGWSNATYLFNGTNPTLSINKDGKIYLIYESNDSISKIMYTGTTDFLSWITPVTLSDTSIKSTSAVADVDSMSKVNVFWIEKNSPLNNTLVYAGIVNDTLSQKINVVTKNEISDIAIANHLQYANNDLFFAFQFNVDSIVFFKSNDNMQSLDTVYETKGYQPCITFNSYDTSYYVEDIARFLYIDNSEGLIEIEYDCSLNTINSSQLLFDTINYVCIDDVVPPIGYSYLFMKNGVLYHDFSYGLWGSVSILDTISDNPINPSIAYKTFNFYNIDYIWMKNAGTYYNIYYKRDAKHIWVGLNDLEKNKGFTITGYPNPFSDKLTIKISVENTSETPQIKIFNSNSQLISVLKPVNSLYGKEFKYVWTGMDLNGNIVKSGIYVILCSVGNNITARKVAFMRR